MGWRNYKEGARNHYVTLGVVVFSGAHGRTSHAIIWVIEVWIEDCRSCSILHTLHNVGSLELEPPVSAPEWTVPRWQISVLMQGWDSFSARH